MSSLTSTILTLQPLIDAQTVPGPLFRLLEAPEAERWSNKILGVLGDLEDQQKKKYCVSR